MRLTSWLISLLLHVGILCLAVYWPGGGTMHVNLDVPVYHVDLVSLAGPKSAKPGPAAKNPKPAKEPAKPVPAKAAPVKVPPKQAVAKPEPPKPKAKDISDKKKTTPEAKPEKQPEKKAPPKPKPKSKPEKKAPTPEELLAQALKDAQKKAAREQKQQRSDLDKELAAITQQVQRDQALREAERAVTGSGDGGGEGGTGAVSFEAVYLKLVEQEIRANWTYPNLATREKPVAVVEIQMDKDGRILDYALIAPSGRPDYDSSVLKAIQRTRELPAPPKAEFRKIRINFNLQE